MLPSFKLTVLGCSSALPTINKHQTAHILNICEQFYLLDAGEGVQSSLKRYDFNIMQINHIFISHLHGDHFFGIYGLISTMGMMGRTRVLDIFAPAPLQEIISFHLRMFDNYIKFKIICHEVVTNRSEMVYENSVVEVYTIPLKHTVPCVGYLFKEKMPERNIVKFAIDKYNLSIAERVRAKRGEDIVRDNGELIKNEDITYIPFMPRSFAYCCDTAYREKIAEQIKGVNLMLHESTFLECDIMQARKRGHSTALQAAKIANLAEAKKLILCHFSTRYNGKLEVFEEEAKAIFADSYIGREGVTFDII